MSEYDGTDHERWRRASEPLPTSAVRVNSGECAYEECENVPDYLVKVETSDGRTTRTRVCQNCNDENDILAERYLPPETASRGGDS